MSTSFEFPTIHAFPPFFTKQPNQNTYKSQRQQWQSLILAYAKHDKLFKISLSPETLELPLFNNKEISRVIKVELLKEVVEDMVQSKTAEWTSKKKDEALIFYRTLEEWSQSMLNYINDAGMNNSILTIYEIIEEGSLGSDFRNMDQTFLRRIVDILTKKNKAVIMKDSTGTEVGIKFF